MNDFSVIEKLFGDLGKYRECPEFWTATPETSMKFIGSLKEAEIKVVGKSASGRDIIAIEYGAKEPLDSVLDNLAESLSLHTSVPDPTQVFPKEFYGSVRRVKPAIVFQGAMHGGELSGTVASLNLCNVIERGVDLKGRAWPELQRMARECRIAVIPWINPDGTSRCGIPCHAGLPAKLYEVLTYGVRKNGVSYAWLEFNRKMLADTAWLGSYYNDNGINLYYDYTEVERQPETKSWMRYYLEERPDAVLAWHCDSGSMMFVPPPLVPAGFQHQASRIGASVQRRMVVEGIKVGHQSWVQLPGFGKDLLNQASAIYHCCGALPLLCELPCGTDYRPFNPAEIVDIGLYAIEELLAYALSDGLRPFEYRPKVMKQDWFVNPSKTERTTQ